MLKSKNAKSQYVAPIEHFRMKAKKLMFSDTLTDQFYCRYRNLISHRTFGISLQVISDLIKAITVVRQLFLRQHSIHQIRNEQVVTVLAFIGLLEKRKCIYLYYDSIIRIKLN